MEKIAISNPTINKNVETLREQKNSLNGILGSLKNEIDNINVAWEGADAVKYLNKMRDDYTVLIEDFNKCFEGYIDFLSKVYKEYDNFNDNFKGKKIEV